MPHLDTFLRAHPGVMLHIGEGDGFIDMVREGVDCVIRIGEPADSSLVGRRLGMLDEGTFASPAYLSRHGAPTSPDDLSGHEMIGFVLTKTRLVIPLEFQTEDGVVIVPVPPKVTVTAAETMACLAIHGHGLIQVPRYRVARELRDGLLVEVLPDYAPTPSPVHILHPEGRHLSSRARAFIDWASGIVADQLTAGRLGTDGQAL